MAHRLALHILGPFVLRVDGEPVHLGSRRMEALLAYLALRPGEPQPRQVLSSTLWPDSSEAQSRTNLRNLLHKLKARLPVASELLRVQPDSVTWRPTAGIWVDGAELKRCLSLVPDRARVAEVLALYRGDLLLGHYDDWVESARRRLRGAMVDWLRQGMTALKATSADGGLFDLSRKLGELEPLDEEIACQRMRLLAHAGERSRALAVFRALEAALEEELGEEPEPGTQALATQIARGEVGRRKAAPQPPEVIGRGPILEAIAETWAQVERGGPRLLVLRGAVGLGKSKLLEASQAWALGAGLGAVLARPWDAEGDLPYGVAVDLLREAPLATLPSFARADLRPLFPMAGDDVTYEGPGQRRRLFESLNRLASAMGPTVFLVDDADVCDQDSLAWLHYFLRSRPAPMALIILALRPGRPADAQGLERLLEGCRDRGICEVLELPPLDLQATRDLAALCSGGAVEAQRAHSLHRKTRGNPLFIQELVRAGALEAEGLDDIPLPHLVERVLTRRLEALSAPEERVLSTIYLGGLAVIQGELRAALGDEVGVPQTMKRLLDQGLIREVEGGRLELAHALFGEVLEGRLDAACREGIHRAWAHALVAHCVDEEGAGARIAAHLVAAGAPEAAAPYLVAAGTRHRDARAPGQAAKLFSQALEITREPALIRRALLGRAECYDWLGEHEGQDADLAKVAILPMVVAEPRLLAEVRNRQAQLAYVRGDGEQALAWSEEARALAVQGKDRLGEALAWSSYARARLQVNGDTRGAVDAFRRAAKLVDGPGPAWVACEVYGHLAGNLQELGEDEAAQDANDRALSLATALDDPRAQGLALGRSAHAHLKARRHLQAVPCAEAALALARDVGDRTQVSRHYGLLGLAKAGLRRFGEAQAHLEVAASISKALGEHYTESLWYHFLGVVEHVLGEDALRDVHMGRAVNLAKELKNGFLEAFHLGRMARMAGERGDVINARRWVAEAKVLLNHIHNPLLQADLSLALGFAFLGEGDAEAAAERMQVAHAGYQLAHESIGAIAAQLGLARAHLMTAAPEQALARLEPLIGLLEENDAGLLDPHEAWWLRSEARRALGDDAGALADLTEAHRRMEGVCRRLPLPRQAAYREQVPVNVAILERVSQTGLR